MIDVTSKCISALLLFFILWIYILNESLTDSNTIFAILVVVATIIAAGAMLKHWRLMLLDSAEFKRVLAGARSWTVILIVVSLVISVYFQMEYFKQPMIDIVGDDTHYVVLERGRTDMAISREEYLRIKSYQDLALLSTSLLFLSIGIFVFNKRQTD